MMAELDNPLFKLELIKKRTLSELDIAILTTINRETPDEVAYELDYYCPPLTESDDVLNYLWAIWDVMFTIASSPDVTSEVHQHLMAMLQCLAKIDRGELTTGYMVRIIQDLVLPCLYINTNISIIIILYIIYANFFYLVRVTRVEKLT
jgi:hypothetical protein